MYSVDKQSKLNGVQVDLPIKELLKKAHDFEGVTYKQIHEAALAFVSSLCEADDALSQAKDKHEKEAEDLKARQDREEDEAREKDFLDKQKEIQQKRRDREQEKKDKESSKNEALEYGTDELRKHFTDGTPGQEDFDLSKMGLE